MTTIAPDAIKLRAIDEETRRAWTVYSERVRELSGEEYALVEDESWALLQEELGRLADQRKTLTGTAD
ncbi:MAG: hypothetical protein M3Z06_10155 [Actinomycetota bacterium]|nr:hypothetical protein [Actinomycetota bacterium]